MAYLYKNSCYANKPDVYASVASYCDPIAPDGSGQYCKSYETGFTIVRVYGTVHQESPVITPNVELCNPNMNDYSEFAWLLVGILLAGFAIKSIRAVIK